jgi:transposase-like protein
MTQEITDRSWQAEARTQETKQLIRDIKRITRRKFTAEEKIRIVLEGFRRDTPIRDLCLPDDIDLESALRAGNLPIKCGSSLRV